MVVEGLARVVREVKRKCILEGVNVGKREIRISMLHYVFFLEHVIKILLLLKHFELLPASIRIKS